MNVAIQNSKLLSHEGSQYIIEELLKHFDENKDPIGLESMVEIGRNFFHYCPDLKTGLRDDMVVATELGILKFHGSWRQAIIEIADILKSQNTERYMVFKKAYFILGFLVVQEKMKEMVFIQDDTCDIDKDLITDTASYIMMLQEALR